MDPKLIIQQIKKRVDSGLSSDFSGLGIIIITNDVNSLPLDNLLKDNPNLSAYKTENDVVEFLFKISNQNDKRHDGFHIVSIEKGLISISQYFSPPISRTLSHPLYDVGARHRTAQYGSLCENISLIIIVSQTGVILTAHKGVVEAIKNEPDRN